MEIFYIITSVKLNEANEITEVDQHWVVEGTTYQDAVDFINGRLENESEPEYSYIISSTVEIHKPELVTDVIPYT